MQENNTNDWSIGCYTVQHQLNLRPSEARGNQVPYECYYGPRHSDVHTILGTNAQRIRTEVGLQLIDDIIRYLKDNNPLTHLEDKKVINIIERGDALYDEEEKLQSKEEKEEFGLEDRRSELFAEILAEILDADDEIEDFLHCEKQDEGTQREC